MYTTNFSILFTSNRNTFSNSPRTTRNNSNQFHKLLVQQVGLYTRSAFARLKAAYTARGTNEYWVLSNLFERERRERSTASVPIAAKWIKYRITAHSNTSSILLFPLSSSKRRISVNRLTCTFWNIMSIYWFLLAVRNKNAILRGIINAAN